MSKQKAFLEKVHIKNFLSLRNVELPLKPLTVLVGTQCQWEVKYFECFASFQTNDHC